MFPVFLAVSIVVTLLFFIGMNLGSIQVLRSLDEYTMLDGYVQIFFMFLGYLFIGSLGILFVSWVV